MSRETSEARGAVQFASTAQMNPTEPQFARGSVLKATQERVKRQHAIIIALREENDRLRQENGTLKDALRDAIVIAFGEQALKDFMDKRRGDNAKEEPAGGYQRAGVAPVSGA